MLELYADDAVHYTPRSERPIRGKSDLKAWFQLAFDVRPRITYELERITPFENRVIMEYMRHRQGEPTTRMAESLEINPDGLISESRVYIGVDY